MINIEQLRDILALSFKRILLDSYMNRLQFEQQESPPANRREEWLQRSTTNATPTLTGGSYIVSHDDAIHQAATRVEMASQFTVQSLQRASALCKLSMNHMLHKLMQSLLMLRSNLECAIEAEYDCMQPITSVGSTVTTPGNAAYVTPISNSPRRETQRLPQLTTVALECINNLEDCLDIFDLFGLNEFDPYFRLMTSASVRWSIPNPHTEDEMYQGFLRSPGMCMPRLLYESPPVNTLSQTTHLTSVEQATCLWVWRHSICYLVENLANTLQSEIGLDFFNDTETLMMLADSDTGLFPWRRLTRPMQEDEEYYDVDITNPSTYTLISTYCRNIYAVLRACMGLREGVSLLYWYKRNLTD